MPQSRKRAAVEVLEVVEATPAVSEPLEEVVVTAPETEDRPPEKVRLVNPSLQASEYVPLLGGKLVRLAPKQEQLVLLSEITDDTRRLESSGRVHILNQE